MLKSISKKGFTLVEVLCSLGVFSIIFICMMSFDVASLNMKKNIKTINNNVFIMEAVKNNIIYSMTYVELNQLNIDGKCYINKENISLDENKMIVNGVFCNQRPALNPYMMLTFLCPKNTILEGKVPVDRVYKINLALYSGKPNDIVELQCNFYKGDHK